MMRPLPCLLLQVLIVCLYTGSNKHLLAFSNSSTSSYDLNQTPSISSGRSPPPSISTNPIFTQYSKFMERVKREYPLSKMYKSTREVIQDQFSTLVNQFIGENDPKSVNVSPNQSESATSASDVNMRDKRDDSSPNELAAETLEAILYFTNGLILTEAVATNQVNVTHIAIDLMIIGQMATYDDWIDVVGSANVDDATKQRIEGQFEKLHELWNVIENGFQETLNTDLIATTISVMDRIPIIDKVIKDTQNFDELLTRLAKLRFLYEKGEHEATLRSLVRLPNALKAFQKLNSSSNALNSVFEGTPFIIEFGFLNTSFHLSEAMKLCMNVNERKFGSIGKCLDKLKQGFQNLTIPDSSTLNSLLDAKIVFDLLGLDKNIENWQGLIAIGGTFKTTANDLRLLTRFVEKRNSSIANNKEFRLLVADLGNLRTSIKDLKLIEKSLSKLQPVQFIVEEFIRIHKSTNSSSLSKKSFIPSLKRYKGLPNGILSIEELSKRIGPGDLFPPQMFTSKVVQRVDVLKTWVTQLTPIVGSSGSFQHILYLLDIIAGVIATIEDKIPADLVKKLDEVESYYKKIPPIGTIETTLANVFQIMTDFEKNAWKNGFVNILKGYVENATNVDKISKLLNPLPDCISFASKIKIAIQPYVKEIRGYKTALLSVKKIADDFPKGVKSANKLQAVIDEISIAYIENVDVSDDLKSIKENMKKSFVFNMSNLKENDYDEDQIVTDLESCETRYLSMSRLNKNKYPIVDFLSNVTMIKVPSTSIPKPSDPIVQRTVDLVKELEKPRNMYIKLEPSDAISKLMNGASGTGIETLELIQPGVIGYRGFVDGMESLAIWESEIKSRTKRQISDEELINEVKSLMEGLKPVQLSNSIKPSVYGTLNNISTFIDPLSQFRDSLKNIKSTDVSPIATKLKAAWGSSTDSPNLKNQKWKVYRMVSSINGGLADKIENLIFGFKSLHASLLFVNCERYPDQPVCSSNAPPADSINKNYFILISIFCAVLLILLIAIVIVNKKKSKQIAVEQAMRRDEVKKLIEESKKREEKKEASMRKKMKMEKALNKRELDDLNHEKKRKEKEIMEKNLEEFAKSVENRLTKKRGYFGCLRPGVDSSVAYTTSIFADFACIMDFEKSTVDRKLLMNTRDFYFPLNKENQFIGKGRSQEILHASRIRLFGNDTVVAMQLPMAGNNEALLDSIFHDCCAVIVQLCSDEQIHPVTYMSNEDESRYLIEVKSLNINGNVTYKECVMTNKSNNKKHSFSHFILDNWREKKTPESVDEVIEIVRCCRILIKNGPLYVMCTNGGDRSMTFCAYLAVVYRIDQLRKKDEFVKFTDCVNETRKERYGACSTVAQFAFGLVFLSKYYESMAELDLEDREENGEIADRMETLYYENLRMLENNPSGLIVKRTDDEK